MNAVPLATTVIRHEPSVGSDIQYAADAMVRMAALGSPVACSFNDIELTCSGKASAAEIVEEYHRLSDERGRAYAVSPEGVAARAAAAARLVAAQVAMEDCMTRLPALDFADLGAVIDWLSEIRGPSDHNGVTFDRSLIASIFATHGYGPGVFCGDEFDGESMEISGRWLIGQALAGLCGEVGAIHQIFDKFAGEWKAKFTPQVSSHE